jgi:SAM-dependent methyltransferase
MVAMTDLGQSLDRIEGTYDTVAAEYAKAFQGEHGDKPGDREMLLRFSQELCGARPIWDFGCGPGQTAEYLRTLGMEVSGLDLSEKILDEARIIHPKIHFRKGNILDLEFDSNSIAGVVAFYAIVHFSRTQVAAAFHEVFRVLRPGGLFLFTFHVGSETLHIDEFLGREVDVEFMFFTTEFIVGCLQDAGFAAIDVTEREPYPGVEYESRRAYVFARKPVSV